MKFNFSDLTNIELIMIRKAVKDFGAEEDKEFIAAIDEELRIRVKNREALENEDTRDHSNS